MFETKEYTGNSWLVVMGFTLFSLCWVWVSKYEFLVSRRLMGNGNEIKPQGLGTGTDITGNRNWRHVLVPFTPPIRYIRIIKYWQERTEIGDIVIIGCFCSSLCCPRSYVVGKQTRMQ